MSTPTEKNRNRRRDKKIRKKKTGMRVDDSARKLAMLHRDLLRRGENEVWLVPVASEKFVEDYYNGRSRPD